MIYAYVDSIELEEYYAEIEPERNWFTICTI